MTRPLVSFIIATHNRRDVILHTLARVYSCGLGAEDFEILVVDNASTDGTAQAIRQRYPFVNLMAQSSNRGPCAKNAAIMQAAAQFVVFLDDDSYPDPNCIARMIDHFRFDPQLGAAVFAVNLPDGSQECSAYPDVCIGCGTGFRRRALTDVGGLPDDFFMAAEEYDLSLRLLDRGWKIARFDDLQVTHLKSPLSRSPWRIARLDARNNVLLAMRYFPEPWRMRYVSSWLKRYRLFAVAGGLSGAFWRGAAEGLVRGLTQPRRPISEHAFEQFSRIRSTTNRLREVVGRTGWRKLLLIDLGKNYLAYLHAAGACDLEVVAFADERLGGYGFKIHGIPILNVKEAQRRNYDAAVISNLSPVHAAQALARWQQIDSRPSIDLFESERVNASGAMAA